VDLRNECTSLLCLRMNREGSREEKEENQARAQISPSPQNNAALGPSSRGRAAAAAAPDD
jgi:hypothetical protein